LAFKKIYFILTLISTPHLFLFSANAQDLWMSRDVKQAYNKGTRSLNGMPGKDYWQNRGRYNIVVTVMPPDRNIKGEEHIAYFNSSSDTLRELNIKLILNSHKPNAPRTLPVPSEYLTSGIHIDEYTINSQRIEVSNDPNIFTNQEITLTKPLPPHDSLSISFSWHYELSGIASREGVNGGSPSTFFLAYFYPRIAVYDDYNGWDQMPFMEEREFYNDFNDYTVTLNVPPNFLVWGTGTLQHPENLLEERFLRRFELSLTSDTVTHIITPDDWNGKNVTMQNAVNSWQFKSYNIPDVTFGISDHYTWDGCSVVVDQAKQRRVNVQTVYSNNVTSFQGYAENARRQLYWLSQEWPGIPYPYEKAILFQGEDGCGPNMEYPMMVRVGDFKDTESVIFTNAHEIAHSYMPFYTGINETRYGFMDEGWAELFSYLALRQYMGKKIESLPLWRGWIENNSPASDIPIITPEDNLTGSAVSWNEYGKAFFGYMAIKDLLGDKLFKKCLDEYIHRWNGKHPLPWDFFFTFNNVSGKNLDWFWKSWFFSNYYLDYSIKSVTKSGSNYSVTIDNIGGLMAPVDLVVNFSDGSQKIFHQTPAIWQINQRQAKVNLNLSKEIGSINLDGGLFADADQTNNLWKAK